MRVEACLAVCLAACLRRQSRTRYRSSFPSAAIALLSQDCEKIAYSKWTGKYDDNDQ